MNIYHKRKIFFVLFTFNFLTFFSQTEIFQEKFSKLFNYTIVPKTNVNFKEYYEITIQQSVDHFNPHQKFNQRVYVGFQDVNVPTVIVTDGYAIEYASKSDYNNELTTELKANLVVVEHRFFGKSMPDSLNWNVLTAKQAADDYHVIKGLLDTILTGKWLSTGISKGGQAALAYKIFYPKDVEATVVYGTAVKNKQTVFTDSLLFKLSQTACGKKINELQRFLFKHKDSLMPYFSDYVSQKNFDFKPLDNETVLDYLLLELPYSYWQNGNNCTEIPDTSISIAHLANYIIKIVPPRFFSIKNKVQLESAFYMFYHEFGYYEYNISPFKNYLKQSDYSNNYFTPKNVSIQFDNTFQKSITNFLKNTISENIFFIYGQNDPWALQTIVSKNSFIVPFGSHKSRIADFNADQRLVIFSKIKKWLN